MNSSHRQQFLAIAAIAAVAILVGDRLVLTPLVDRWKQRADQIETLRNSVATGALLLDRDNAIRDRWEDMRDHTLAGETSVAENQLLKAFDRWSRDSRVSISSIRPQWRQNAPDFITLECRVDASGDLSTLSRFLYEIERDPLAVKLETMELTSQDENGRQLGLALTVSSLLLIDTNRGGALSERTL
jgi:hypothetical protein